MNEDRPYEWHSFQVHDRVKIHLSTECPVHSPRVSGSNKIFDGKEGQIDALLGDSVRPDGHRFCVKVLFRGVDNTLFPLYHWVAAAELELL